jgi:hypothetical protein
MFFFLNPGTLLGNLALGRDSLEVDMVLYPSDWGAPKTKISPNDCRGLSGLAFAVWVAVILTGFAVLSVALGIATVGPAIFAAP